MKTRILLFAIVLFFFSCDDKVEITNQRVFFEVHYVNFAWSYSNRGILIDSMGNVSSFDLKTNNRWNYPDSLGYISCEAMNENVTLCDSVVKQISNDSLSFYVKQIDEAARGKISEPVGVMYDAGGIEFIAYTFDHKTDRYKKVLLHQWGDFQITNNAPEAQNLHQWLMRVCDFY